MDNKYYQLIDQLNRLTINGNLFWQKTSSADEYMIELNATSFIISKANNGVISLDMFNEKNIRGTIVKCDMNNTNYSLMYRLYSAVLESISKDSAILSAAMNELYSIDNK